MELETGRYFQLKKYTTTAIKMEVYKPGLIPERYAIIF